MADSLSEPFAVCRSLGQDADRLVSRSAGPGTRANIDEFTQTTARAVEDVGRAVKGKAIIIWTIS